MAPEASATLLTQPLIRSTAAIWLVTVWRTKMVLELMRACKSLGIITVVVIWATASPALATQEMECSTYRYSAEEYWFWEGYLGFANVEEQGDEIFGRLLGDPSICFRVEVAELDDPAARTRGYKEAIEQWYLRIPDAADRWSDPDVVRAREALARLTGERFDQRADLKSWLAENNDYLLFSEEEGHLTVVKEAKKSGRPLVQAAGKISASQYWSLEGRGWILESFDRGDVLVLRAWIPPDQGGLLVKVNKAELDDRSSKEDGYRHAVGLMILDGVGLKGLSDAGFKKLATRLESITGESYSTASEWIEWWNRNKDDLVLSSDGHRLTVRSPKVQ